MKVLPLQPGSLPSLRHSLLRQPAETCRQASTMRTPTQKPQRLSCQCAAVIDLATAQAVDHALCEGLDAAGRLL